MNFLVSTAARIVNRLPVEFFQFAPVPVMHRAIELNRLERMRNAARFFH